MSCECKQNFKRTQIKDYNTSGTYCKRSVTFPSKDRIDHEINDHRSDTNTVPNSNDSTDCDCNCGYEVPMPTVKKTKSRIKWPVHNQPTSKYHSKCLEKKHKRINVKKTKLHTMVTSDSSKEHHDKVDRKKFKNECYCGKTKNPLKYSTNLCDEFHHKPVCQSLTSESNYSVDTMKKAKELLSYSPESKFLRRLRNEVTKPCICLYCQHNKVKNASLKYTSRRDILESGYVKDVNKYCDNCKCTDIKSKKYCEFDKESLCEMAKQKCQNNQNGSCSTLYSNEVRNCDRVSNVQCFRKKNYFECHSTEKLIPEHKCLYSFYFDDRLLPEPLNPNVNGISQCDFCNKPMRNDSCNKTLDKLASVRRNNMTKKCEQSKRDMYRKIQIEGKRDIVELHVPESVLTEHKSVKVTKPSAPSYGLRFQKLVI